MCARKLVGFLDFADDRQRMNPTARPVGHGIQPLVEAVLSAGGNPEAIRTAAWHAAWARGYDDVIIPAIELGLRAEGFLIVVQPIGDARFAAVVDTGSQLWAINVAGHAPPTGSRVRVAPSNHDVNGAWDAKILDPLTLGFHVAFEQRTSNPDTRWIQPLKDAMHRVRDSETHRRHAIDHSRSTLPTIEVVPSVHDLLHTLQEELRERIKAETAPSAADRARFEHANIKEREKIAADTNAARAKRFEEEAAKVQASVPDVLAGRDAKIAQNEETRLTIQRLEDVTTRSRAITERTHVLDRHLDAIANSNLHVDVEGDICANIVEEAVFHEVARNVELLHALIPRHQEKTALRG